MIPWLTLCAALATGKPAQAQEPSEEPLLDELTRFFQRPSLSIGALLQTVGSFQPERTLPGGNGFSIATMRLRIYGELDSGFGYFFQTNFAASRPLLDARMYYRVAAPLVVDAGVFKVPFSREFLTYAGSIDFVNRSRVVAALAPGRQIGVQAGGALADGAVSYRAGVFNGNRFAEANTNDNDEFLYAVRLAFLPFASDEAAGDALEIAINGAFSRDDDVRLVGFTDGFNGDRFLIGADVRWTSDRWLVAGEAIAARLDAAAGPTLEPYGWQLTSGYMLTARSQLLARWDVFESDDGEESDDLVFLGCNVWPTGATEVQVNYGIPTGAGFDEHQLLVNFQIGF